MTNAFGENSVETVTADLEESPVFRQAQLVLLLHAAAETGKAVNSIDRLGIYDFYVSYPFSLVERTGKKDRVDRTVLNAAGFNGHQLSYSSAGSRYVRRRQLLQADLALLVAHGIVAIAKSGYVLSLLGAGLEAGLTTSYADAYRCAAGIVVKRLSRLSDSALNSLARKSIGNSWLLIDFSDDIRETEISRPNLESGAVS